MSNEQLITEHRPPQAELNEPQRQEVLASTRRREARTARRPVLRFSPTAWAKLMFFRDRGDTEIGGFGITPKDDLLYVAQFVTVRQDVSAASVSFEDASVADYFDAQVDEGRRPEQFARHWIHSHPFNSPAPSSLDQETFGRVFGSCQWAVMFIVSSTNKTYARMSFNVGPKGSVMLPVEVDYSRPFGPSDHDAWRAEYEANVRSRVMDRSIGSHQELTDDTCLYGYSVPDDWLEELEDMDPSERRLILQELSARGDPWEEKEQVHE